jgi:hypothetical protein
VAADRIANPPRTLAAWLAWQRQCRAEGKFTEWAEVTGINWSGEEKWGGEGPSFWWYGVDHPFKGQAFCWRCLALAQGLAAHHGIPHTPSAICWQTGRHPGTKDPVEDSRAPRVRVETDEGRVVIEATTLYFTRVSAEGTPLGPRERIFPPSFAAGPPVADTGTLFYVPPESRYPLDATGWCAPKPVQANEPERAAQPDAEPVQASDWPGRSLPSADWRDSWPPTWTDEGEPGTSVGDT